MQMLKKFFVWRDEDGEEFASEHDGYDPEDAVEEFARGESDNYKDYLESNVGIPICASAPADSAS